MCAKNKKRDGVVYSTNDRFEYDEFDDQEETLAVEDQLLYISLDRKMRKGKTVTLVEGFIGSIDDLKVIAKEVKKKCGAGGAVKDGYILVQGDFKDKVYDFLSVKGYKCKKKGG